MQDDNTKSLNDILPKQVNEQGTISSTSNYVHLVIRDNNNQYDRLKSPQQTQQMMSEMQLILQMLLRLKQGRTYLTLAGDAAKTASGALNKTDEAVNATVSEVGKNASGEGSSLLNQTGEVAKKIVGGAGTVLGNISGEIKEGVGAK